ncbi:MAG: hypothetical protein IJO70_00510 [Lachnospiraceae bacterium]|nr:hypothetical protein [Lachnospiraceae bacterium]
MDNTKFQSQMSLDEDNDYQPIFYGPRAQIRKELPKEFMDEVDKYDRENNFPDFER